ESEYVFAVAVVVLQGDFDFDIAALAFHVNRRIVKGALAAVEMLHELADSTGKAELGGFLATLIGQTDFQTLVEKCELAQTLRERVIAIGRLVEDGRIRVKSDFRAGLAGLASLLQFGSGLALLVSLFPDRTVARNLQLKPVSERIDY